MRQERAWRRRSEDCRGYGSRGSSLISREPTRRTRLGERLICTSNISDGGRISTVNYSSYLNDDDIITDNAGLMLINILRRAGVDRIALAGYDGFDAAGADNYFDGKLNLNVQYKNREDMNIAMKKYFEDLGRDIDIHFVTPSIYEKGEK